MHKKLDFEPSLLRYFRQHSHEDDFTFYVDAQFWTKGVPDTGSVAVTDAVAGVLVLTPSDATVADNDQAYIKSTQEVFLFASDKPFVQEWLVKFVEANTDDANVIVGVGSAVGADTILDDGAGPKANDSSAWIYKVDGETVWRCETSVGTVQTISISTAMAGGSQPQRLRIEFQPTGASQGEVTFYVDGVQLRDAHGWPIKHTLTFTNATEMAAYAAVKNGGTNLDTLSIDSYAHSGLR